MEFCVCLGVRKFADAVTDLREEIDEVLGRNGCAKPSGVEEYKDELSDISWSIGRLVAGVFGKVYVRVPGDRRHAVKIEGRMSEYGCVRSKRHLVNGVCASA